MKPRPRVVGAFVVVDPRGWVAGRADTPTRMGQRWTAPDGWEVEGIRLGERDCFRVRHHKALIGYAYTLVELEQMLRRHGLAVADLTEAED